jgi:hypothetical protein
MLHDFPNKDECGFDVQDVDTSPSKTSEERSSAIQHLHDKNRHENKEN